MTSNAISAAAILALAGCATDGGPRPGIASGRVAMAPAYTPLGLERVIGQGAAGLTRLFGTPDAEMREGEARKLQFAGPICVLDAYLYPNAAGDLRVTWLDARQVDGSPIDRASCVAALTRRAESN